jgi:endonuclease/exonuclease/phosphatase family metal-dependent hydrolase
VSGASRRLGRLGSLLAAGLVPFAGGAAAIEPGPITATSFNIRFGTAEDGENRWERRRESVFEALREGGDLLGLQEALPFQVREVAEALPGFAFESRGRDAEPDGGEACPIFWRTDRYALDRDDHGTFWLSETPDTPGSRSWDSSLPRIATFVRLVDRTDGSGIYVFNTHLDHRGERARAEGARVIAGRIAARKRPADPVIVLGDFNDGPGSAAIRALRDRGLVDAWRAANPAAAESGTFNGWKDKVAGERIDFILASPELAVVSATIDDRRPHGRWPSDHLPVRATFRRKP